MTFSDDDVVGEVQVDTTHSTYGDQLVETGVFEPVHFRDLDEHIQDRLRAAEEVASRPCVKTHSKKFTCINTMGMAAPAEICPVCTLATYEATFKENPT